MLRPLRLVVEFFVAFVGVIVLLGVVAVWRLNANPISSDFLTPYIESGINNLVPETQTQIAHSLLTWDNIERSITLKADGVTIKNKDGAIIAEVPDMHIQLSVLGILLGQFLPTELVVDHPQIRLERRDDGQLYFGEMPTTGAATTDHHSMPLRDMIHAMASARFTRTVHIQRAVLDVRDPTGVSLWAISVPSVNLDRSESGLNGHIAVDLTQKDSTATLDIHYAYDRAHQRHSFATRFDNIQPSLLAGGYPEILSLAEAAIFDLPLTGAIAVAFDDTLALTASSVTLQGGAGRLNAPDLWDRPREVKSFDFAASYDRASALLNVSKATIDFDGPTLDLTATGHAAADPKQDMDFTLSAQIKNWPMDEYTQLWPKPLVPNAREWMAANLAKGIYDHGSANFKGSFAWHDLANLAITEGKGSITASRAQVSYIDGMPPVQNVNAEATFDLDQMAVKVTSGGIGGLKISPFTVRLTELSTLMEYIDIPLKLSGPVTELMQLIDNPPLGYARAIGLSPDQITGRAEGEVDLHFPLLKTLAVKDVDIKASAHLVGVASSKLVKGVDVTQGMADLDVTKNGFGLKGTANLNGIPSQITWQQNFVSGPLQQATVKAVIRDDQWKTLGTDALNGTRGTSNVTLQMIQPSKNKMTLSGDVDMTATETHIDQLNWKKPFGVPAHIAFTADIPDQGNVTVQSITLRSPQASAKGKAVITTDGELQLLTLEPLAIGRTNASLYVTQSDDDDRALRIEAYGASLDVSGLRGGKDPARSDPRPKEYRIKVDTLYTSDVGYMTQAEGFAIRDPLGWNAIGFHGMADGTHRVDIDLKPQQGGGRVFSATCEDFGKALKGLGFSDQVRKGNLKIYGASIPDHPRVIEGTVKIGAFDVRKLPVLMLLLNATSPFGLLDILSDNVSFDRLKGKFRWEGDTIDLQHIEAAGNSVGMNIDGKVDMNSGQAKLRGTLVPFSMVNGILESIPLIGDLLTGGNGGGVLAVNYSIDGSLDSPKVGVNPVSLLTPGFLRNLFFGGNDEDENEDKEANTKSPPSALETPVSRAKLPPATTNFNK